jgi:hypothetical protein
VNDATPSTRTDIIRLIERFFLLVLIIGIAGFGGYGLAKFESYQQSNAPGGVDPNEGALRIPETLTVPMSEPVEIRADTSGRRVIWMSLDQELKLRPIDNRACWLYGTKSGEYRLIAWTAVNNLPTQNAVCIVKVGTPEKTGTSAPIPTVSSALPIPPSTPAATPTNALAGPVIPVTKSPQGGE